MNQSKMFRRAHGRHSGLDPEFNDEPRTKMDLLDQLLSVGNRTEKKIGFMAKEKLAGYGGN